MSVFYPIPGYSLNDVASLLSNTILVVPSVSVANVPQLAIDLLICSLDMKLVGRLSEDYVYPFAGPRDLPSGTPVTEMQGITTALEVYTSPTHGMSVIQMRSPTLPGCRNKFVYNVLLPFIKQFQFPETVIAGSSNSAFSEVMPPPRFKLFYECPSPNETSASSKPLDSLSARLSNLSISNTDQFLASQAPSTAAKLPESGIVLDALNTVAHEGLKVSAAVLYVFEGDNFEDARELADRLAGLVELDKKKVVQKQQQHRQQQQHSTLSSNFSILENGEFRWIEPMSWNSVYGKEIPIGLEEGLYS